MAADAPCGDVGEDGQNEGDQEEDTNAKGLAAED